MIAALTAIDPAQLLIALTPTNRTQRNVRLPLGRFWADFHFFELATQRHEGDELFCSSALTSAHIESSASKQCISSCERVVQRPLSLAQW
jgi:hypothetical protein